MQHEHTAPKTGRKPKDPKAPRFWETRLHDFLRPKYESVPGLVKDGRINTKMIADKSNVSRYTVYRWFGGHLTMRGARDLVAVTVTDETPKGTVAVEELVDYIS